MNKEMIRETTLISYWNNEIERSKMTIHVYTSSGNAHIYRITLQITIKEAKRYHTTDLHCASFVI
jgi:uncharacterized protein with FMN-binding domain